MSKKTDWRKVEGTINAFLGLKISLIGVKLRKSDIQGKEEQLRPEKPMAFCHMVRIAALHGKTFLYDITDEACPTAQMILGFRAPKYVEIEPRVKPADTKSILIAPINQINEEPDVVIAILTPKQMMNLIAVLQAGKHELMSVEFRGDIACAEFTAKPYMDRRPNMSLLCGGARIMYSDFQDDELVFGAPPEIYIQAAEVMDRITKTQRTPVTTA